MDELLLKGNTTVWIDYWKSREASADHMLKDTQISAENCNSSDHYYRDDHQNQPDHLSSPPAASDGDPTYTNGRDDTSLNMMNRRLASTVKTYTGPTIGDIESALSQISAANNSSPTTTSAATHILHTASSNATPDDESSVGRVSAMESSLSKIEHKYCLRIKSDSSGLPDDGYKWRKYGQKSIKSSSYTRVSAMEISLSKIEHKYCLRIKSDSNGLPDDGYRWRKYGQKSIKSSPHTRSYYKCTNPRCGAKKQVERSTEDPETLLITYAGLHLHFAYPFAHIRNPGNQGSEDKSPARSQRKTKRKISSSGSPASHQENQPNISTTEIYEMDEARVIVTEVGKTESEIGLQAPNIPRYYDQFPMHEKTGRNTSQGLLEDVVPMTILSPIGSSPSSSSSQASGSPSVPRSSCCISNNFKPLNSSSWSPADYTQSYFDSLGLDPTSNWALN